MNRSLIPAAAALAAALSLAACGISRQEAVAMDNGTCEGMGLKFGTPEFAQCRLMQDQRRDAADAAARASAVNALQNFNNTVQSNTVPYSPPPVLAPVGPQRVDVYTHRGF